MRSNLVQKQTLEKTNLPTFFLNGVYLLFCITFHLTSPDETEGKFIRTIMTAHSSYDILGEPYNVLKEALVVLPPGANL